MDVLGMRFDWNCQETYVLLNPRMDQKEQEFIRKNLLDRGLKEHFWLMTSGTCGRIKGVALSKRALLESAKSVNYHINATTQDKWVHVLPDFHVGGLSIYARAFLSSADVVKMRGKWDPYQFVKLINEFCGTLTSLVPAQIYDLIYNRLEAPSSLRAVFVGGGALSHTLYEEGIKLKWKLIPTYGLTECSSQVATASIKSKKLKILDHIQCRIDDKGYLYIKSPSLLTTYAYFEKDTVLFEDPKKLGWFHTEDRIEILGDELNVVGRGDDFIKIGGESVDLKRLNGLLLEFKIRHRIKNDAALVPVFDSRLGHVIHLVCEDLRGMDLLIGDFNKAVLPFEKIRKMHQIDKIPRTYLNKLILKKLLLKIGYI